MCIVLALIVPILAALLTWPCRWAFGVCLWEIFSFGKCNNLSFCFNSWLSCCCIFNISMYLVFSCMILCSHKVFSCSSHSVPLYTVFECTLLPASIHFNYFLEPFIILITSCMHAGDLPYSELGNTVILSRVMAGYRLDCPQGCTENMYAMRVDTITCIIYVCTWIWYSMDCRHAYICICIIYMCLIFHVFHAF